MVRASFYPEICLDKCFYFHPFIFGLAVSVVRVSDWFSELLSGWIPWDWAGESTLYQWLLHVMSFIILLGTFKYIVLIITGPLMSLISEKLENELSTQKTGRKVPGFLPV